MLAEFKITSGTNEVGLQGETDCSKWPERPPEIYFGLARRQAFQAEPGHATAVIQSIHHALFASFGDRTQPRPNLYPRWRVAGGSGSESVIDGAKRRHQA
jgi:hypothetical protein